MKTRRRGRSPGFVFLEFLDPEINALLAGLQRVFGKSNTGNSIHITVRGPYPTGIPESDLIKFNCIVQDDPILIHGIGKFRNPEGNVVFIRVASDSLKKIWWKPDFPEKQFGFNPHISLHRTVDPEYAETISDFLKKEEIKLICHKFRLVPSSSRQGELFPSDPVPQHENFRELANRRLIRPDILLRASRVVEAYERKAVRDEIVHVI